VEKNRKTRAPAKTGFSGGDTLLRAQTGLSCNYQQVSCLASLLTFFDFVNIKPASNKKFSSRDLVEERPKELAETRNHGV
jgi:hypothetical protein